MDDLLDLALPDDRELWLSRHAGRRTAWLVVVGTLLLWLLGMSASTTIAFDGLLPVLRGVFTPAWAEFIAFTTSMVLGMGSLVASGAVVAFLARLRPPRLPEFSPGELSAPEAGAEKKKAPAARQPTAR